MGMNTVHVDQQTYTIRNNYFNASDGHKAEALLLEMYSHNASATPIVSHYNAYSYDILAVTSQTDRMHPFRVNYMKVKDPNMTMSDDQFEYGHIHITDYESSIKCMRHNFKQVRIRLKLMCPTQNLRN